MASNAEEAFLRLWATHGNGLTPEPEYRFHDMRKWRFDFAWPAQRVAVEIEGGIWSKGRHVRGAGFIADCEKYNEAARLGWYVLRIPAHFLEDWHAGLEAMELVKDTLEFNRGE